MNVAPWTAAPLPVAHGLAPLTLVDGDVFLICPCAGDLDGHGADGFFMLDTRVLSRWRTTVDGAPIDSVAAVPEGPFSARLVGLGDAPDGVESELAVVRRRHVGRGLREDLELRWFGRERRSLVLAVEFASDFASLFEVKAGLAHGAGAVGVKLDGAQLVAMPPHECAVDLLTIAFDRTPDAVHDHTAVWEIVLAPGGVFRLCTEAYVTVGGTTILPSHRCGEPIEQGTPSGRLAAWRSSTPEVVTDDEALARSVRQAVEDLGVLRIFDRDHGERVVVAAGAPWFMTLFGRDALLTAWMALLIDHDLARGVLSALADAQGTVRHTETEEQPGRILHEVRYDHTTARLLGGRNAYYGTVDATPLFVMLVAELARWTGRREDVEHLLPAVDRAMAWIEQYGDLDGDGFVEYRRANETGLANQGWKDSWDGIRYGDGRVAGAPVALSEVQGYVFAALEGRATLASLMGDTSLAQDCRRRAATLRQRFDEQFWMPWAGTYAVGLDGAKRHIDSITSNTGHCLWTGIVPTARSAAVAEQLGSDRLFSGWGIRTLDTTTPGYNPLSYHCGSVWPHDTAIAVAGLARHHHDAVAARLLRGLVDAAAHNAGRLPELFAGFSRSDISTPVPYPTSCAPQAWAAASPLLLVRSMLGLEPDLTEGVVRLRPRLPAGVGRLAVRGMPLGQGHVTIEATADGVEVYGLDPSTRLVIE